MENVGEGDLEKLWIQVLADVARQVKWERIKRSWLDVFEHRLEFAKYEPDVKSLLQRLCNTLSIQGLKTDYMVVDKLHANNDAAMRVLRKWTRVIAGQAFFQVFHCKEVKNNADNEG